MTCSERAFSSRVRRSRRSTCRGIAVCEKMRVDGPYDLVIVVAHALYLLVKLIQTGHISAQGRVDTHHAKLFGEDSFDDKPAAVVFQSSLRKHPAETDILLLIEPERVLVTGFSLFVLFFHMSRFKGARLGSGTRPRREGPLSDKHRFVGQRYTLLPSGDGKCVETTQGTTDGSNPSARGASRAAILQRFSLDNKSFDRPGTASMRHTSKASEGILSSLREMNDSPPAIMR